MYRIHSIHRSAFHSCFICAILPHVEKKNHFGRDHNEHQRGCCFCNLSVLHAGHWRVFLCALQGRRRQGVFPGRPSDGRMGVCAERGRVRHERVGAHGSAGQHLCGGYRPGMDRHRPVHRLCHQLAGAGAPAAPLYHRGQRFHHRAPVSDQPLFEQVQGLADHLRGDLPGGLHCVCRLLHEGLRHSVPYGYRH